MSQNVLKLSPKFMFGNHIVGYNITKEAKGVDTLGNGDFKKKVSGKIPKKG